MKGKWIYLLASLLALGCGELPESPVGRPGGVAVTPAPQTSSPSPVTLSDDPISVFFSDVWATVSHNRSNPRNIAACCAAVIDDAQLSLDVCGHEIDNEQIIDAILRAHQRGVAVRVVSESDYAEETGPRAFADAGVPLLFDGRDALMHNKFIVIDRRAVWTGSFNFTENGAYKNNNNAVLIRDERVAANFAEKFRWFWEEKKFGGRPSRKHQIPYPVVQLADGTTIETYFSTHDNVDQKVIAVVRGAKESIEFLAFSFTHDDIAQAMLERADRGVDVRGVFETRQNSKYSEFDRLDAHRNVHVLLDGNRYNMHHKVIIVDREIVVTGSYNFSASATSDNDENIVIIHNAKIAEQFHKEFANVYTDAQRALAGQSGGLMRR